MSLEATGTVPGNVLKFTSASADYVGGQVVECAGRAGVIINDIDFSVDPVGSVQIAGLVEVRKVTGAMTAGVPLYWDENGTSVSAETGAATTTQANGDFVIGSVSQQGNAASGDERVSCQLNVFSNAVTTDTAAVSVAIPFQDFLKTDLVTPLPAAGDSTNLGLVAGTHGTNGPSLQGADAGATTKTEVARLLVAVPADYDIGDLTLTFHAGMLTTLADDVATLDVQVYETDEEAGVGSDLCETAAQSINSLTLADKAYVIDGDGLAAGDVLDIEITTVVTDAGNLGVMKAIVGHAKMTYTKT